MLLGSLDEDFHEFLRRNCSDVTCALIKFHVEAVRFLFRISQPPVFNSSDMDD